MLPNQKKEDFTKKKPAARELFLKGTPIFRIAEAIGIARSTIHKWTVEDKWEEEKVKISEEVKKNMSIDIVKEKERSMELIKLTEEKYKNELDESGRMPKSVPAFTQLQRVKFEILNPRGPNQININQDITPKFEIVIEGIDEDKHKTDKQANDSVQVPN
jgi:hypothetical protein